MLTINLNKVRIEIDQKKNLDQYNANTADSWPNTQQSTPKIKDW